MAVCRFCFCFCFPLLLVGTERPQGNAAEPGSVPPALAVASGKVQIQHQSTRAPKKVQVATSVVTPPRGRLADYGTGPKLTGCPI